MHPPQHLLPWLTYTGYLTEHLYAKSGHTALQIVQQIWEPSNAWDHQRLGLASQQVLHRDIVICAWERPCWFARTILPESTYQAHVNLFDRLNVEPLGNLIFHTQSIQRLSFEYYPVTSTCLEYTWLPETIDTQQQDLWVRLSTFQVEFAERFYLVEILLPDLEQYC